MSENKAIQLGLCCLNMTLRGQNPSVFASRKMIIRTIKQKGIYCLKLKIIENLCDVLKIMDWNEENGIEFDIMIEAKCKELAIEKLYENIPS